MRSLVIRKYRPKDFKKVLKMGGRSSKRRAKKFELVGHGLYYCYIAEDGSDILGFIIMEDWSDEGLNDIKSHYMVQINVAEKRKGIGRKLVEMAFEKIGPGGHVSLCVNADNRVAIKFYKSLGFRRSGFTRNYRKGQNKRWYEKDLAEY